MTEWERWKGESARAYASFEVYRDMGPDRSLRRAYSEHLRQRVGCQQSVKRVPGRWQHWSVKWSWEARAAAYDKYLSFLRRAQVEEAEKADALRWAEVRRRVREQELEYAEALIAKAKEMLSFPLSIARQVNEDGKLVTIIESTRWSMNTVPRLIELADRLMRGATEMESCRWKIDLGTVKAEAKRVADEYGLPVDEVLAEAERIAQEFIARNGEKF